MENNNLKQNSLGNIDYTKEAADKSFKKHIIVLLCLVVVAAVSIVFLLTSTSKSNNHISTLNIPNIKNQEVYNQDGLVITAKDIKKNMNNYQYVELEAVNNSSHDYCVGGYVAINNVNASGVYVDSEDPIKANSTKIMELYLDGYYTNEFQIEEIKKIATYFEAYETENYEPKSQNTVLYQSCDDSQMPNYQVGGKIFFENEDIKCVFVDTNSGELENEDGTKEDYASLRIFYENKTSSNMNFYLSNVYVDGVEAFGAGADCLPNSVGLTELIIKEDVFKTLGINGTDLSKVDSIVFKLCYYIDDVEREQKIILTKEDCGW